MKAPAPVTLRTEGLVDQERIRQALECLREVLPQGITRSGLAARIGPDGVSLRSVDRILGLLVAQGAEIQRPRSGQPPVQHLLLRKGPAWDEHVSPETRLALRLASMSLTHCGTLLWQDKLDTLERLATHHMSVRDRRLFATLERCVQVHGGVEDPIESPDILEPILQALEGQREIQVAYQGAGNGEARPRRFVPYCLTHDLFSGAAFLAVWDPADRKPKHLRLNRLTRVKVTSRPGVIADPEGMARAARYQIGGWICADAPFEVRLRVRGVHWVQSFKEAPPALPEFVSRPAADGLSTEVSFQANHALGATRWILQLGEAGQVLAPAWLREEVRSQLRRTLDAYQDEPEPICVS
jgi:predicted DNA-binding transcriptional regulator YafY